MNKTKILTFSLLLTLSISIFAQSEIEELLPDTNEILTGDTTHKISEDFIEEQSRQLFLEDSPIVRALDSLFQIRYFNDSLHIFDSAILNRYGYSPKEIPTFSDSVYRERIAKLNRETTIPLVYNQHVLDFINLYAVRKRGLSSRMLGLSYIYFPMFEELLD
ncbi:MAG TPA: hypothetical protein PK939_01455, partial [Bacteroidales bacterium]|nr:hypothetical protein [Bacteroidales bacterium]